MKIHTPRGTLSKFQLSHCLNTVQLWVTLGELKLKRELSRDVDNDETGLGDPACGRDECMRQTHTRGRAHSITLITESIPSHWSLKAFHHIDHWKHSVTLITESIGVRTKSDIRWSHNEKKILSMENEAMPGKDRMHHMATHMLESDGMMDGIK